MSAKSIVHLLHTHMNDLTIDDTEDCFSRLGICHWVSECHSFCFLYQFEAPAVEADPRHLCWGPYNDISGKIVLAESDSRCGFEDQVKMQ